MSQETSSWLNQNVLVGMTDQRGTAWHYRASDQGDEPNHYTGAIPVADVHRRLFDWEAIEVPMYAAFPADVETMDALDEDREPVQFVRAPGRKVVAASDTHDILGVFKDGYVPHQYGEWLVEEVSNILDDSLVISSAGLLRNRALAWVEVSIPESITSPEGVTFRPNILAATSFDGSMATRYKRTVQLVVCDNTMSSALGETGEEMRIRHSAGSKLRKAQARQALNIVHSVTDSFSEELTRLTSQTVTEKQWTKVLDALVPMGDSNASVRKSNAAERKRDELHNLYDFDARVSPWKGTAFGVLQAFNTWEHHFKASRGAGQVERNMVNVIKGATEKADDKVLELLAAV